MSRTLFRYIFLDLLRIFLMANGALAGIMSFAGLLKPLTQNGLDASQVGQLLTYFTPAMMAYSFPIAALFATTVVYGRMSADNEIVACRAGGISHLMIALPAFVLGLVVSIISLLFLCFIVPQFTLKVEKVIYSNFAQFVANKIERNHQMKLDKGVVFAQRAEVIPPDANEPYVQRVVLEGPTIINYDFPNKKDKTFRVPEEFWMARKATLYIRTDAAGEKAEMSAVLDGGMKFPRKTVGGWEVGVAEANFGPIAMPSLIRENTKFMDITKLKELDEDKSKSRKIASLRSQFVADEQESRYLDAVEKELRTGRQYVFVTARAGRSSKPADALRDVYYVSCSGSEMIARKGDRLIVSSPSPTARTIRVWKERSGVPAMNAEVGEIRLRTRADPDGTNFNVSLELSNLVLHEPDGDIERGNLPQAFAVPMDKTLRELSSARPEDYASADPTAPEPRKRLMRELIVLKNDIATEMHSRGAFALSCLILVMVGCALGMMFRSGNFLSAFALSFVPALACITLIIAGQRTGGNIPDKFWEYRDPLRMGVAIIWSGNAFIGLIAAGLLFRLQRK